MKNIIQGIRNFVSYSRERVYFANSQVCSRRYLDAERLMRYFELNKCERLDSPEHADYIIIITCAFHGNTERQSLELIESLKKFAGELIVVGCLPAIAPARFHAKFNGKYIETSKLSGIDSLFPHFRVKYADVPDSNFYPLAQLNKNGTDSSSLNVPVDVITRSFHDRIRQKLAKQILPFRSIPDFRHRHELTLNGAIKKDIVAYLRISDGCQQKCAYCGIRTATGDLRSKPIDVCLNEYQELLNAGYRNFWILGTDTGAYGMDIGTTFGAYLNAMNSIGDGSCVTWCIHEMNPMWAIKYEKEIIQCLISGRITEMIIPIQSASERILKLMNRFSDVSRVHDTLKRFRDVAPDLRLVTYLLPGFPTETDDDFMASIEFVKRIGFNQVILFVYSDREGIISMDYHPQIDEQTKAMRRDLALKVLNENNMECICMEN